MSLPATGNDNRATSGATVFAIAFHVLALISGVCVFIADSLALVENSGCGWDYPEGWQSIVAVAIWPVVFVCWIIGLVILLATGATLRSRRRLLGVTPVWILLVLIALLILGTLLDRTLAPGDCLL